MTHIHVRFRSDRQNENLHAQKSTAQYGRFPIPKQRKDLRERDPRRSFMMADKEAIFSQRSSPPACLCLVLSRPYDGLFSTFSDLQTGYGMVY